MPNEREERPTHVWTSDEICPPDERIRGEFATSASAYIEKVLA